jgi:hypothetical protein
MASFLAQPTCFQQWPTLNPVILFIIFNSYLYTSYFHIQLTFNYNPIQVQSIILILTITPPIHFSVPPYILHSKSCRSLVLVKIPPLHFQDSCIKTEPHTAARVRILHFIGPIQRASHSALVLC